MEKEASHDEKERKKQLDKLHAAHNRIPSDFDKPSLASLRKQEENFKIYMEKTKSKLKLKESELNDREKAFQDKWVKITASQDFVEFMRLSVEKINSMKAENEQEREVLEREKLDIINWNEKIRRVWASIESYKKSRSTAEINEQIRGLGIDAKKLGFN
jgi:hypothetical protein